MGKYIQSDGHIRNLPRRHRPIPTKQERKQQNLFPWLIVALIVALLALALFSTKPYPAGAQEEFPTPKVLVGTEEGLPSFGFYVECPGIAVTVLTDIPYHGTPEARCGSFENPAEVLYVFFSCGEGLSSGVLQAFQEGNYLASASSNQPAKGTVYTYCSQMANNQPAGFTCYVTGAALWITLPIYDGGPEPHLAC